MSIELVLKFVFEASHSLAGHEVPHPHLWKLECSVGGKPIQGKILDIVELRARIEQNLEKVKSTYLNENPHVGAAVREFPTCETLSQYFMKEIQLILNNEFVAQNPSISIQYVTVALCEMNGIEMGAVRLRVE